MTAEEILTGRSLLLLQLLHTFLVFWYAGSGETVDLPWLSCTDFLDAHSHYWLWNLALRRQTEQKKKQLLNGHAW